MSVFRKSLVQPKVLILAAVVSLAAILVVVAIRAMTPAAPAVAEPSARPLRPALTPEEERYIGQLWPIHGDVERSTMQLSLGQILYKTGDVGPPQLENRVEQALVTYQAAASRLRALEPPTSLRGEHEEYLAAVGLFEASAVELRQMFKDGRDEHMQAAYPKSQEGSDKIREVGGKFWPHEFPPH